jgi:hypothetical protein
VAPELVQLERRRLVQGLLAEYARVGGPQVTATLGMDIISTNVSEGI